MNNNVLINTENINSKVLFNRLKKYIEVPEQRQ